MHETIVKNKLFKAGERVAVAASGAVTGAHIHWPLLVLHHHFSLHLLPVDLCYHMPSMSLLLPDWPARAASSMRLLTYNCHNTGGKDSTVLAHILTLLNARHGYGLDLFLLSIDEGITGYRDDSLETVKRNEQQYGIPLKILSYQELYGWTMDDIVRAIGHKNNCTFCGVFRRQALDRGAALLEADRMATGGLTTRLQLNSRVQPCIRAGLGCLFCTEPLTMSTAKPQCGTHRWALLPFSSIQVMRASLHRP